MRGSLGTKDKGRIQGHHKPVDSDSGLGTMATRQTLPNQRELLDTCIRSRTCNWVQVFLLNKHKKAIAGKFPCHRSIFVGHNLFYQELGWMSYMSIGHFVARVAVHG